MVYRYVKKPSKYKEDDIEAALQDIRHGRKTVRAAAKHYSIDKSLLSRRFNGKGVDKRGRKPALGIDQEKSLANCLQIMSKWGFGLSKEDVKNVVQDYVQQNNLVTPFISGKPGKIWYKNFEQRNHLSLKKAEPLEANRRKATSDPFIIFEFYELLEEVINKYNLSDKPNCIYNLDETSFSSDPSRIKVVAKKGEKVHRNIQGSGKENTTVLACVNAAGGLLPPLVIFQGVNLWTTWRGSHDIPGTFYAVSDKGWMTSTIFQSYFEKFCSVVRERPLLLIFDGHLTHLDPGTIKMAIKEEVVILKLPSHTTDLLQPLDKCCFRPLKLAWDKKLIEWQMENQRKLSKAEFVDVLCEIWHIGITPQSIVSGFMSTGIYPLDKAKYPISRLDPIKLQNYNLEKSIKTVKDTSPVEDAVVVAVGSPEILTDTGTPEGSGGTSDAQSSKSFEELLLKKLKKTEASNITRRKVDIRAKVVTTEEFLKSVEEKTTALSQRTKKRQGKAKTKTKLPKPVPNICEDTDSDNSMSSWKASGESDGGEDFIGEQEENSAVFEVSNIQDLQEGDFILANFTGGKRNKTTYKYVCIIQHIFDDGEIEVMGMNCIDTTKTVFKTNANDISTIAFQAVIGKLPTPLIQTSGERLKYIFKHAVDISEH